MGIKIKREKRRIFLASFLYRLNGILPFSKKLKFRLYLNLAWIFERLAHEMSFKIYTPDQHPVRRFPKEFIYKHLDENFTVLDLGCKKGELTNTIAEKAKIVVGIDFDKSAIEYAQKTYTRSNVEFFYGEALAFLQKNKEQFDLLVLSHILEHLDNPKDFIFQFKDYFDYIYIELPDFDKTYLNHYRKDLKLQLVYTDDDHVSEFDRYELSALLAECNIEIVEAVYIFGIQQLWCRVKK